MADRAAAGARLGPMAPAPDRIAAPAPPWTLSAAAALVSIEALAEVVAVSARSGLTVGLRSGLVLCLALKWLFAARAHRLHPGAALGLLLLEGTTVVAALGATEAAVGARLLLGATALAVLGLLSASLHAFPSALPPAALGPARPHEDL